MSQARALLATPRHASARAVQGARCLCLCKADEQGAVALRTQDRSIHRRAPRCAGPPPPAPAPPPAGCCCGWTAAPAAAGCRGAARRRGGGGRRAAALATGWGRRAGGRTLRAWLQQSVAALAQRACAPLPSQPSPGTRLEALLRRGAHDRRHHERAALAVQAILLRIDRHSVHVAHALPGARTPAALGARQRAAAAVRRHAAAPRRGCSLQGGARCRGRRATVLGDRVQGGAAGAQQSCGRAEWGGGVEQREQEGRKARR